MPQGLLPVPPSVERLEGKMLKDETDEIKYEDNYTSRNFYKLLGILLFFEEDSEFVWEVE